MKRLPLIVIALAVSSYAQVPPAALRYPTDAEVARSHAETEAAQTTITRDAKGREDWSYSSYHRCAGAELISTAMKADSRHPSENDISGVWTTTTAGVRERFALTQLGRNITGLGDFSGCTGYQSSKITGTREGRSLQLKITYCNGQTRSIRYAIIDYQGTIALAYDWLASQEKALDSAAKQQRWEAEKLHPALVRARKLCGTKP